MRTKKQDSEDRGDGRQDLFCVCTIFLCQYSHFSLLFKKVSRIKASSDNVTISDNFFTHLCFFQVSDPTAAAPMRYINQVNVLSWRDLAPTILFGSIFSGSSLNNSVDSKRL